MEKIIVSFPGFGIGEMEINKVAFSVFGREVRWYGILITLGMLFAFCYAFWRCRGTEFTFDDVVDLALWTIIPGVLGARLYYVLMTLDTGRYQSFIDVIAVWEGGLAIYGGVIGGILGATVACRIKKKNLFCALDFAAPGTMFAQALGRWGNFCNGEAYGGVIAEGSPLYFTRMGLYPNMFTNDMAYVHPTFLYESLWNLIGFVLINLFYKHKKFNGEIVLMYLTWYGFGRMFIEGLRSDSLYIFGHVRVSQLVGFLCFICGLTAIIVISEITKRRRVRAAVYEALFGNEPETAENAPPVTAPAVAAETRTDAPADEEESNTEINMPPQNTETEAEAPAEREKTNEQAD